MFTLEKLATVVAMHEAGSAAAGGATTWGLAPAWRRGIGGVPYVGIDSGYVGTRKWQYLPKDVVRYLLSAVLFGGPSSSKFKALRDFSAAVGRDQLVFQ